MAPFLFHMPNPSPIPHTQHAVSNIWLVFTNFPCILRLYILGKGEAGTSIWRYTLYILDLWRHPKMSRNYVHVYQEFNGVLLLLFSFIITLAYKFFILFFSVKVAENSSVAVSTTPTSIAPTKLEKPNTTNSSELLSTSSPPGNMFTINVSLGVLNSCMNLCIVCYLQLS